MSENQFFKPTVLYKEYMILDMIEKNPNITQREMSKAIGIAVSMINDHINEYENKGLVKRKKHSTKTVEYFVTKKGSERKKVLNIGYLNSAQHLYNSAKENIEQFLFQIQNKGFKNVLLYGAGEVCEILLSTLKSNPKIGVSCPAIIDDDLSKKGTNVIGVKIINRSEIKDYVHDGILISSFTNKNSIKGKLMELEYNENKILNFFD
ncbi:MAG: winged helix-turn-helix transcriptional regulator [Bacilli bacterium]|nr:winged helix-turn-helix transcriptional regulator [Bacilli bacterium]